MNCVGKWIACLWPWLKCSLSHA